MTQDINDVDMIVRREIEALFAVPMIREYMETFGEDAALTVAQKVIKELAFEAGKKLKQVIGGNSISHLKQIFPLFGRGGALEFDILEANEKQVAMNVTRCKYAEMYEAQGLKKLGLLLSCDRDYALMEGFNPDIKFTRTQTIMEGAKFCDFRFSL